MNSRCSFRQADNESGYALLSVLAYIPCCMLLGVAILQIFSFVGKQYIDVLGNQELMQHVRIPLEEMAKDIRYAEEINVSEDGHSMYIRREVRRGVPIWQSYQAKSIGANYYKIYKKSQPMVGNTMLSAVNINVCKFQLLAPYKVRVIIGGTNRKTGHSFAMDAVLYSCQVKYNLQQQEQKGGETGYGDEGA